MRSFQRIAVYCGSSSSVSASYLAAADHVGRSLAKRGIGVVYGGGKVGMMGKVADGALAEGGDVVGVITEKLLSREVGHDRLSTRYVVSSMHSRKTMMAQLAEGFIALPGGWGTLEEIFEVTTWSQLNYHLKPVGLLNIDGYYDKLVEFIAHASAEGFIRPGHRELMQVDTTLEGLLEKMAAVEIPDFHSWRA